MNTRPKNLSFDKNLWYIWFRYKWHSLAVTILWNSFLESSPRYFRICLYAIFIVHLQESVLVCFLLSDFSKFVGFTVCFSLLHKFNGTINIQSMVHLESIRLTTLRERRRRYKLCMFCNKYDFYAACDRKSWILMDYET